MRIKNMSFDLFILLDESTSNLQQMWVEKMKQVGVDVKFPVKECCSIYTNQLTMLKYLMV